MIFSRTAILLGGIVLFASAPAAAQSRLTREEYVERYKSIAVAHMERYGIPASITMAQGILESDSGNSRLSVESNNHFGIKCKRGWTGPRVFHDDDAPDECFRAYESVEASYHDHAVFLDTQPRYDSLFAYPSTDYKSWARGLKAAGYATAPDYAQRLVRLIESMKLYLLDQPQGERVYAAHKSGKSLEEITKTSYSDAERLAVGGYLIDPDNYRVTINAHEGRALRSCQGERHVREHRPQIPPVGGQPAQVQRREGPPLAARMGRSGLHRAQADGMAGQCPAPHLPRGRNHVGRGAVLRHPHAFARKTQRAEERLPPG